MKSRISIRNKGTQPRRLAEERKPKTVTSSTQAPVPPLSRDDVQRRIARRAYELYESRGRDHGHALEDWLKAEREILGERSLSPETTSREEYRGAT